MGDKDLFLLALLTQAPPLEERSGRTRCWCYGGTRLGPTGSGASLLDANIGLQFNAGFNALAGETTHADIGFRVAVVTGSNLQIEDFGLAQISGVLPNGSATVTENGCGPAPCTPGPLEVMTFDFGGTNTQRVADSIFTPTGSVQVSKGHRRNRGNHWCRHPKPAAGHVFTNSGARTREPSASRHDSSRLGSLRETVPRTCS